MREDMVQYFMLLYWILCCKGGIGIQNRTYHLLLTGKIGCGKSTALLSELKDVIEMAGGYRTVRLLDRNGTRRGFAHIPPASKEGVNGIWNPDRNDIFLIPGEGMRTEVLLSRTIPMMEGKPRFFLLDEIGGKELLIPTFYRRLEELFSGEIPCIGVLKSANGSAGIRRWMQQTDFRNAYNRFVRMLSENPRVKIADGSEPGGYRQQILQWKKENGVEG